MSFRNLLLATCVVAMPFPLVVGKKFMAVSPESASDALPWYSKLTAAEMEHVAEKNVIVRGHLAELAEQEAAQSALLRDLAALNEKFKQDKLSLEREKEEKKAKLSKESEKSKEIHEELEHEKNKEVLPVMQSRTRTAQLASIRREYEEKIANTRKLWEGETGSLRFEKRKVDQRIGELNLALKDATLEERREKGAKIRASAFEGENWGEYVTHSRLLTSFSLPGAPPQPGPDSDVVDKEEFKRKRAGFLSDQLRNLVSALEGEDEVRIAVYKVESTLKFLPGCDVLAEDFADLTKRFESLELARFWRLQDQSFLHTPGGFDIISRWQYGKPLADWLDSFNDWWNKVVAVQEALARHSRGSPIKARSASKSEVRLRFKYVFE
jgi:hypothetical protein